MNSLSSLFAAVALMTPNSEPGAQSPSMHTSSSPLAIMLSPIEWIPTAAQADEVDLALRFGEQRVKVDQYQRIYAGHTANGVNQIKVILTRSDYYGLPEKILYRARLDEGAKDKCGEYLAVYNFSEKALVSLVCTGR